MKKHFVYFYGSTRITSSGNRNQIIGFVGIDKNPELVEVGEKCLNGENSERFYSGHTETLYPKKNITIIPFRYEWCIHNQESQIIKHLEDVIDLNERYIEADSIGFPLMALRSATHEGYSRLGKGVDLQMIIDKENTFKSNWCCFGHYYLYLIKIALYNKGYSNPDIEPGDKVGNLINTRFYNDTGMSLIVNADAGI